MTEVPHPHKNYTWYNTFPGYFTETGAVEHSRDQTGDWGGRPEPRDPLPLRGDPTPPRRPRESPAPHSYTRHLLRGRLFLLNPLNVVLKNYFTKESGCYIRRSLQTKKI